MAIFNYENNNFIYMVPPAGNGSLLPQCLAFNLWDQMVKHGFKVIATNNPGNTAVDQNTTKVILEPKAETDPLIGSMKWRIYMETYSGGATIPGPAGTDGQATVTTVTNTGLRFCVYVPTKTDDDDITKFNPALYPLHVLVPPTVYNPTGNYQYPRLHASSAMSLSYTATNRGIVIAAWTNNNVDDWDNFAFVCIQRAVGCGGTVDVSATGQKPLFMVSNLCALDTSPSGVGKGPHNGLWYQVLRESDTNVATPITAFDPQSTVVNGQTLTNNYIADDAERQGTILYRVPLRWQAPVISDTNQYHLIFPFGLCSGRFAYSDEIDLIAISKSDAYRVGQQIPINVYGESGDRLYNALMGNNKQQSAGGAVRLFVLADGPNG
jgi:hypothetical protein